jgi:hypothetical protein
MTLKYAAAWAAVTALFFGCAIATAQSAPRAAEAPAAPGVTSHPDIPTESDPNQPAANTPDPETPTAGHDAATGKDQLSSGLTSPSSTQVEKANAKHPDFLKLDSNNRGYLIPDDVKDNKWLSVNFARCDVNHDGHLTQQEYANCK